MRETQSDWRVEYPAKVTNESNPEKKSQTGQQEPVLKWQLDDVSLAALLRAFGPDDDQASRSYARLRERLCRFFEWNRARNADELADETLDRLARRLGRAENLNSVAGRAMAGSPRERAIERPEEFAVGIARLVLHEQRRRQMRAEQALEEVRRESDTERNLRRTEESRRAEELTATLDRGMAKLSQEQQELIRRYYSVEGRTMIDARKRLAQEMGISINALRNRALRIRTELESHVRSKLNKPG